MPKAKRELSKDDFLNHLVLLRAGIAKPTTLMCSAEALEKYAEVAHVAYLEWVAEELNCVELLEIMSNAKRFAVKEER